MVFGTTGLEFEGRLYIEPEICYFEVMDFFYIILRLCVFEL